MIAIPRRNSWATARWPQPGVAAAVILYALVSVALVAYTAVKLVPYGDWNIWEQVPGRLAAGTLYEHAPDYTWAWSPLAAWLIAAVVVPMGPWAWAAIHFGALGLLRDPRLILVVTSSYPFWMDTMMANAFTFVAVTGYAAWHGNRWAAIAFLALLVLMPRPVQLPLAALLLWRDRSLVRPFAALVAIGLITTVGSGYLSEWIRVLVGIGGEYPSQEFNLSPTRLIGPGWLVAGTVLAGWLVWRGRPGWAGLAISPYVVPQYLLVLIFELRPRRGQTLLASPPSTDRESAKVVNDGPRQDSDP